MDYCLPKFKDYVGQPVRYLSPKMDGHMQYITVLGNGKIVVTTKNHKDNTVKLLSVNHIKKELELLPPNSIVMGECHWPGHLATEVPHLLCSGDSRLQFSVFACPTLGGLDLRDETLDEVMKELKSLGLDVVEVRIWDYQYGTTKFNEKEIQQLLDEAAKRGIEGWVLKEHHMSGWYKLKPVKTVDAFVLDVTPSTSETYVGHMKALVLGLYKPDGSVHELGECGGGFTKEFKLSLPYGMMKGNLLGHVCEVEYQSITKHQKLQFPRFVRWRTDKDAVQCSTEQLT
jgi:ATP-dependent DNA ligase